MKKKLPIAILANSFPRGLYYMIDMYESKPEIYKLRRNTGELWDKLETRVVAFVATNKNHLIGRQISGFVEVTGEDRVPRSLFEVATKCVRPEL